MTGWTSLQEIRTALDHLPEPDHAARAQAEARNGQLTKPPGALGRLEELALWYASWRGTARPHLSHPQIVIFAGNHGVTARGVSAFPSEVTAQMVANFNSGGAAINQLAAETGAKLDVHALSLDTPTGDISIGPALTMAELLDAMNVGAKALDPESDLLIVGEMGIGNTTPAAAIAAALFEGSGQDWVGRGTGVDDAGLQRKAEVIDTALAANMDDLKDGLDILRCLGGREIAAMAGAILQARLSGVPMILDGFICTAAAACLHSLQVQALTHCVSGHCSAETAHEKLLSRLGKTPLLSLDMRLGEGSGAAVALGILKSAVACHSGMATFEEAQVSES